MSTMSTMSPEFYWIAVALVVITASARLTRLLVIDKFPPVKWVRDRYENATDGSDWQWLTMCGYCMSFWTTALVVALADLSGVLAVGAGREPLADWMTPAWWLLFGTLGASYAAAVFMARDADESDED